MKKRSIKGCVSLVVLLALVAIIAMVPANAATQEDIDKAITDGIGWLVDQQHADGSWGDGNQVGCTGFAVTKLSDLAVESGYEPLDEEYEYSDEIRTGLNFIFQQTNLETIDGDNVANWGPRLIYETSIAMMAITSSNTPEKVVVGGPVDGKTYSEVVELGMSYLVHCQNPDGGWRYSLSTPLDEESDNSNTGYAVLGLIYAQNKFGITIPDEVITGLNNFVTVIQNEDGSSKYTPTWDWRNILKTGHLLYEMQILGFDITDDRVIRAIGYIQNTWNDTSMDPGWQGNYQAMYTIMKGFTTYGIETINVGGTEEDWFNTVSTFIVEHQNPDGSWPSDYWGDSILTTEWALLTLEKTVEIPKLSVRLDIKPRLCPNLFNPRVKGNISMAILGTESFDVRSVDPETINLGYGGNYIVPLKWSYEDVATPFEGQLCNCHGLGQDGYVDLNLKFSIQQMDDKLNLPCSGYVLLNINGSLKREFGSVEIEAQDCIKIPAPCEGCSRESSSIGGDGVTNPSGCRACSSDLVLPVSDEACANSTEEETIRI